MEWLLAHWMPVTLLVLYILVLAHHAWTGRKQTGGIADYFVGGRSMSGVAIGLSFFATYSSTNSFVGFSGQGYSYGIGWLLIMPFIVVSSLCAWLWVAPRLRRFTELVGSLTLPDFFGFRFGSDTARMTAAFIVLFASLFYMAAVFKGVSHTLEAFLTIPYWLAILIVFLVVMLYTSVGGFISVVKTDMVQGLLLVLAAVLLFAHTSHHAGGPGAFFEVRDLPGGDRIFSWDTAMPFPVLLGILFAGTIKFVVEPRQLSRFYALRDAHALRVGMWISTGAFILVYTLLVPIGIYAHKIFPGGVEDTDQIVPGLLTDPAVFNPAVSSLIMVAMIAAAMSSLDSVLLIMAATCQRDIVGLLRRGTQRNREGDVTSSRYYVAVFAAATALFSLNPPGGVVTLSAFSGSLYAACFFPGLLLGLYWRRGNGKSVMASFLVGIVVLLTWNLFPFTSGIHEVFPAVALSCLAFVVVALRTPSHLSEQVQDVFFAAYEGRSGVGRAA